MKVAVLGLGLMGSAVAEGMLNVGHEGAVCKGNR
jgi:3-hydroxyisobutyrate dehydrogenase-like beta-hydroxyacid dehydrogenase